MLAWGAGLTILLRSGRDLNALALGQTGAFHLGVSPPRVQRRVIVGCTLGVGAGTFTAIGGPNGAGKSTAFRLQCGEMSAAAGSVQLAGVPVHTLPPREQARRRACFAQDPGRDFPFTVREIVTLGRHTHQPVAAPTPASMPRPDSEIDQECLLQAWGAMEDTHDFLGKLKQFAVARTQAFRMAEGRFTRRLPVNSHRSILEKAAAAALPIMVFVGNSGCIEIHTGVIGKPIEARGWYNIMDPGFNLHLNEDGIHETWLVRKPTKDGIVTSIELFNQQGQELVQLFGRRKPGVPELEAWRNLAESVPGL